MRRSANGAGRYVSGRLNFRRAVRLLDVGDFLSIPKLARDHVANRRRHLATEAAAIFFTGGSQARLMNTLPQLLAVGIDENTAVVSVDGGVTLRVVGDGCVYVLDASEVDYSNHEETREGAL